MSRSNVYHIMTMAFFCVVFLLGGCAPKTRPPVSNLDTPEHHVYNGMRLLESGRISDARREFLLAMELAPRYSPAYRGLGLVQAHDGEFEEGFKNMSRAKKYAETKKDKALAYVGFMRLHINRKGEGWLDEVEENFAHARVTDKGIPDPFYYEGIAHKEAYRFEDAEEAFEEVLEMNGSFIEKADRQLKLVQRIQRAMPGTMIGKRVALLEKITRIDVAALFVQELKLDKVYQKFSPKKIDASFKSPGEMESKKQVPVPRDIQEHPLKTDALTVLELGIRGLGTFPDNTFAPDEYITRAGYAMMIADIISTITNDAPLSTKFIGSVSPFEDVRKDVPFFNAIMVCTTRGIMESRGDVRNTIFDPMGSVSGADALLALRKLKEHLKIF